jgi:hypothetical protein
MEIVVGNFVAMTGSAGSSAGEEGFEDLQKGYVKEIGGTTPEDSKSRL